MEHAKTPSRISHTPLCVDRGDAQRTQDEWSPCCAPSSWLADADAHLTCAGESVRCNSRRNLTEGCLAPKCKTGLRHAARSSLEHSMLSLSLTHTHAPPLAVRCRCCRRWRRRRPGFHALGWLLDHHPLAPPGTNKAHAHMSTKSPAFFPMLAFCCSSTHMSKIPCSLLQPHLFEPLLQASRADVSMKITLEPLPYGYSGWNPLPPPCLVIYLLLPSSPSPPLPQSVLPFPTQ